MSTNKHATYLVPCCSQNLVYRFIARTPLAATRAGLPTSLPFASLPRLRKCLRAVLGSVTLCVRTLSRASLCHLPRRLHLELTLRSGQAHHLAPSLSTSSITLTQHLIIEVAQTHGGGRHVGDIHSLPCFSELAESVGRFFICHYTRVHANRAPPCLCRRADRSLLRAFIVRGVEPPTLVCVCMCLWFLFFLVIFLQCTTSLRSTLKDRDNARSFSIEVLR
ncbi:hypothetical protein DL93DRAFT_435628 [Clavulina sp. PMI_390]|nr:hypothetical protein DL93DRAFT_435628 [Clavulina sp. PMI_390]